MVLQGTTQTPVSPRLSFRRLKNGDEAFLFPAIDDKLTMYWIDWEPPRSMDEVRQNIERAMELELEGNRIEFLVFGVDSCDFIGAASFAFNDSRELEIGYWVKEEQQRKGYGYEMVQALLYWLQNELYILDGEQLRQRVPEVSQFCDITQVIYSVTAGNLASEAVARKLFELPYQATPYRKSLRKKRGRKREVNDYIISLGNQPLLPSWMT